MKQVEVSPSKKKLTENSSVSQTRVDTVPAKPTPAATSLVAKATVAANLVSTATNSSPPATETSATDETQTAVAGDSVFNTHSAAQIWQSVTKKLDGMTADMASEFTKAERTAGGNLVVTLSDKVNKDFCSKPERKQLIESILEEVAKEPIKVDFLADRKDQSEAVKPKLTRVQQIRQLESNDFVSSTMEIFGAEITNFKEGRRR